MQLSIIIPCYNAEKYLQKCFDSIIVDTQFNDFEVIFVNDGSTDGTQNIINSIKNNNINRTIKAISQENKGLSGARNSGIEAATGDYLFLLDADDYIFNKEIFSLLNQAINENLDVISFKYQCVDTNYNPVNQDVIHSLEYNKLMTGETALNTGFQPSSACLFLYKRKFIVENKLYFTPKLYSQDVEFTVRLMLLAKKVFFTKTIAYIYFFSDNSIKRTKSEAKIEKYLSDQIEIAFRIKNNIETYPSLSPETKKSLLKLSNKVVFSLLFVFLKIHTNLRFQFIKNCFNKLKKSNLYPLNTELDSKFQKTLRPIFNLEKIYFFIFKFIKFIKKH